MEIQNFDAVDNGHVNLLAKELEDLCVLQESVPVTLQESVPVTTVTSPVARKPRKHRVLYLKDDVGAATNDPKKMECNYRLPLQIPMSEHANTDQINIVVDLVISPAYVESLKNEKLSKMFRKFAETGRGFMVCGPAARPVILRGSAGYCRLSIKGSHISKSEMQLKKLAKSSKRIGKVKSSVRGTKSVKSGGVKCESTSSKPLGCTTVVAEGVQLDSIKCLKPRVYLNDEVLDYGIVNVLKNECGSTPDVICFPVYRWKFYFDLLIENVDPGRVTSGLYRDLVNRAPNKNLLRAKYFVIPVLFERHWLLAIFCQPFPDEALVIQWAQKARNENRPLSSYSYELYSQWMNDKENPPRIIIMDSMFRILHARGEETRIYVHGYHADIARKCVMGISWIHQELWRNTGRNFSVDFWGMKQLMAFRTLTADVQQQQNGADCGLFLLKYMKCFLNMIRDPNERYKQFSVERFNRLFEGFQWTIESREGLLKAIKDECAVNKGRRVYEALEQESRDLFKVGGSEHGAGLSVA